MMAQLLGKFEKLSGEGDRARLPGLNTAAGGRGDDQVDSFFQPKIPVVVHAAAASVLGIQGNASYKGMKASYPAEGMPFATWWETVSKLKGIEQWRKKLQALGSEENAVRNLDKGGVGDYIFRHLTADGEISEAPLQPAPPAL